MSGEELYEIYWRIQNHRGVEASTWDDLEEGERDVWEELAGELE